MKWREHFLQQLVKRHQTIDDKSVLLAVELDKQENFEEKTCNKCNNCYVQYEVVHLQCKHMLCVYCCDELIERTSKLPNLPRNLSVLDGLMACPRCSVPSIVERQRVECILGCRRLIHTTFSLRSNFSKDLCYHVEHIYENQRKWLTGYSSQGLIGSDLRGAWSTEEGDAKEKRDFKLPNPAWCWIGDWNVCTGDEDGDENGWQYAFNWPKSGVMAQTAQWYNETYATAFVRRRRWARLRIRLSHSDMVKINRHRPLKEGDILVPGAKALSPRDSTMSSCQDSITSKTSTTSLLRSSSLIDELGIAPPTRNSLSDCTSSTHTSPTSPTPTTTPEINCENNDTPPSPPVASSQQHH